MRSSRLGAWILSAGLLAWPGCKYEPDDKPAADPLADPWVDAIDEEDPAFANAEPSAVTPEPGAAEPAVSPDALALAEPGEPAPATDPATGVLATPTGSAGASKSAATPGQPIPPVAEPGTGELPAVEPSVEPTPSADPAPSAAVEPAKPAAPAAITIADLHGNYRFVGGSAQRADLEAAIEAAAEQLSAAIRGIGRKRLTKTNPIDNTLDIVIAGDQVTTIFETGFDASCVIDGPTVHWTSSKGDQYKVRVRAKGSKLVQIIEGEDGVKTTVFVLSADRQKLTVHHKITADRLDEPMTYRLSYSRK